MSRDFSYQSRVAIVNQVAEIQGNREVSQRILSDEVLGHVPRTEGGDNMKSVKLKFLPFIWNKRCSRGRITIQPRPRGALARDITSDPIDASTAMKISSAIVSSPRVAVNRTSLSLPSAAGRTL